MDVMDRNQAIQVLKGEILKLTDSEHCWCEVAAKKGFCCRGFKRFSTKRLFDIFAWLAKDLNLITREELERAINSWFLAQQDAYHTDCICDVQMMEPNAGGFGFHHYCDGWNSFSNKQLCHFLAEFGHHDCTIIDEETPSENSNVESHQIY